MIWCGDHGDTEKSAKSVLGFIFSVFARCPLQFRRWIKIGMATEYALLINYWGAHAIDEPSFAAPRRYSKELTTWNTRED